MFLSTGAQRRICADVRSSAFTFAPFPLKSLHSLQTSCEFKCSDFTDSLGLQFLNELSKVLPSPAARSILVNLPFGPGLLLCRACVEGTERTGRHCLPHPEQDLWPTFLAAATKCLTEATQGRLGFVPHSLRGRGRAHQREPEAVGHFVPAVRNQG